MSRVCVKNLPKYVAEDNLRDFFSQKGEVTDAKLMRTRDGKSRQFAFIGFRTEQQAEEALKYFNNSYMDTSRITCEIAHKVGDANIPRPWSRHSVTEKETVDESKKTSGIKSSNNKGEFKKNKKDLEVDDPQLREFLEVMQPRSKTKLWGNDTLGSALVDQNAKAVVETTNSNKVNKKRPDPSKVKMDKHDKKENAPSDDSANKETLDLPKTEDLSDMDYFKSKVKKDWSDSDSSSSSESEDGPNSEAEAGRVVYTEEPSDDHNTEASQENIEEEEGPPGGSDGEMDEPDNPSSILDDAKKQILETGRLFVRNLPYTASEEDLTEIFSKFGDISEVHLVVDRDTKRSKGIAYVLYTLPEFAVRAFEELDNSIFQGRLLHILPAKQQNTSMKQDSNAGGQASKSFKQQKDDQRKATEAGGDTRAWNSLFMRPDTVVENIARKYGVSKSDFLDREADDLAVRIALGETHVISDTKKGLANAGINVAALEEFASGKNDGSKRSNHVLLVKNLPYGSSEGDLTKMFGKFGSLDKIILPQTKTLALVVFLEANEARAAFKGLAYKRYKDAPLYLEWAPCNILSPSSTSEADAQKYGVVGEKDVKRAIIEQGVEAISEVDVDPDRVESRSLFVKNLNFRTSDENLKKHFTEKIKDGRILSAKVKKHLKNGKNVSMGFGFIELGSVETATKVCKDLQGTILDGHALILQHCHAKSDEQVPRRVDKDKSSTKLIVRNVAFEATEKDLRQLFSPFGQVKSLRLPMKLGNHRGFAFVEFVTKQEAQNALQQLSSVHLYGRHLGHDDSKCVN
ncbi:multiple RNA-binding domain-containing protein 1-like isoform X2 [Papaver somniferum]|uniref:multiple RNA-binding domain-containing protein 1-like isoform X2 n=1 Tax=Papaver somniferum TaxID=3469 RepID=UPI000E6F7D2A|nr:multiple RNA-binding domain-containing protein 1-like isoform X2 [Papaver somniferum]